MNSFHDTLANKKRVENNQRKLKIISQNVENQKLQNPKINKQRNYYYPETEITKFAN